MTPRLVERVWSCCHVYWYSEPPSGGFRAFKPTGCLRVNLAAGYLMVDAETGVVLFELVDSSD